MAKFTESLDRKLEEIERPLNPPTGHYVWSVMKHPEVDTFESNAGDPFSRVTFTCVIVSATDDVDEDDLAEFGNVAGVMSRKTFMFNESEDKENDFDRAMFQMRQFLEACGVDEGLSQSEAMAAAVNAQFTGELRHRPDKNDPEVIYNEIGKTTVV